MITWVRSANINHGKQAGAIEWAVRVSVTINEALGTNIGVQRNVAGPVNQIHWVATYDSLAAFEQMAAGILQNEAYLQLIAESTEANFFDTHSINDSLYQSVG